MCRYAYPQEILIPFYFTELRPICWSVGYVRLLNLSFINKVKSFQFISKGKVTESNMFEPTKRSCHKYIKALTLAVQKVLTTWKSKTNSKVRITYVGLVIRNTCMKYPSFRFRFSMSRSKGQICRYPQRSLVTRISKQYNSLFNNYIY